MLRRTLGNQSRNTDTLKKTYVQTARLADGLQANDDGSIDIEIFVCDAV
jgi:hypothetical protein